MVQQARMSVILTRHIPNLHNHLHPLVPGTLQALPSALVGVGMHVSSTSTRNHLNCSETGSSHVLCASGQPSAAMRDGRRNGLRHVFAVKSVSLVFSGVPLGGPGRRRCVLSCLVNRWCHAS